MVSPGRILTPYYRRQPQLIEAVYASLRQSGPIEAFEPD
jgi:hypothetical protein